MGKIWIYAKEKMGCFVKSLVGELILLLFASAAVACLLFFILNIVVGAGINYFFTTTSYLEKVELKTVQKLQDYVIQNDLSPSDSRKLSEWVKNQSVIYLEIYRNDTLLYVSDLLDDEDDYNEMEVPYYRDSYYQLNFADGKAEVYLQGAFTYRYHMYALVAELLISFLVFMILFILGVRKRIRYIQSLQNEVGIMQGGCLEHPVTVTGEDELAGLANDLNQLRRSLIDNFERENELRQANQNLIIGIAHDLRTPLTALTMYVQILMSEVCKDKNMNQYYLDKVMLKAVQMKELSDRLFEYCQVMDKSKEENLEETRTFQSVFSDYLSEMVLFLESQGLHTVTELDWKKTAVAVRMDYIARIMDNLSMNLVRYASREEMITICTVYEDNAAGIEICNRIRHQDPPMETSKIGMENVRYMMEAMNGECLEEIDEEIYRLRLLFPNLE
ncbi:histidine kinase dimerization/phospho-acceptor domain-containing protein [Lacrimispora sp. 38-1]|uniref:HAMP domain-containing sensor histidine kinase n=1 Tax=Lacrimispora sp. 38-1 TaxID=3125778 RepID=UPI003CF1E0D1